MAQSEVFDLLAAKMEETKRQMAAQLNREIFSGIVVSREPLKPLTRRERLHRRWLRVRGYFAVLWDALRGRDPYERDDYDY